MQKKIEFFFIYLILAEVPLLLGDETVPITELLDPFFVKSGGLMILSLDDDERLLGSVASMSCTFLLTYAASSH